MAFFENMTAFKIAGIILLVLGALITFLSARISAKMKGARANTVVKLVGLAIVFAGFALIMFI